MFLIRGETLNNGNIKYTFYCNGCKRKINYINILPPAFCFECSEKLWDTEQLLHNSPHHRLFYHAGWPAV